MSACALSFASVAAGSPAASGRGPGRPGQEGAARHPVRRLGDGARGVDRIEVDVVPAHGVPPCTNPVASRALATSAAGRPGLNGLGGGPPAVDRAHPGGMARVNRHDPRALGPRARGEVGDLAVEGVHGQILDAGRRLGERPGVGRGVSEGERRRALGVGAQQFREGVHVHPLVPPGDLRELQEVTVERPVVESLLVEGELDVLQPEQDVQDAGVLLRRRRGAREPGQPRHGAGAREQRAAPEEGPSQDLRSAQIQTVFHRPLRPRWVAASPGRRGDAPEVSRSGAPRSTMRKTSVLLTHRVDPP